MKRSNTLTLGSNRSLYLGELPATGMHVHAAPVLLVGLSGRFGLHFPGGRTETCRSALIDVGVEHVFDPCGESVALMYLEPDAPEARSLRAHFAHLGPVIYDPASLVVGRYFAQARLQSFDLANLLDLSYVEAAPLDARVARALDALRAPAGANLRREALASASALSGSRFNHVFKQEMGVSFRSYRVWSQVRAALGALSANPSLTQAALEGGFVDSSHFSHMFRNTFGMTPSSVLKPLQRVHWV